MQNAGVMQIAFGDYHYHALHADGKISSYGVEPGSCGALGLGGAMDLQLDHGALRGLKYNPWNYDGVLQPHCYTRGRRVWFQKEQEEFVRFMASGGKDPAEAKDRMRQVNTTMIAQACVSEWIEQVGSDWDKTPAVQSVDEDGLGAYFALSVAAAGWHSGALVLVNDKVVKAVRDSCFESNGTVDTGEPATGRRRASSIWDVARNFLGLQVAEGSGGTTSSTDNAEASDDQAQPTSDNRSPPAGKRWRWANWDFPRLRLDYGFQTPGTIDFTEWKEPRPDWRYYFTGNQSQKLFNVPGWVDQEAEPFDDP
jgi:SCF-associated factor 1